MSARDELADLTTRTEGHTRGPWEVRADHGEPPAVWHDSETAFSIGRCADCGVEAVYAPADAELIAAAPELIAALEAVKAVHEPVDALMYSGSNARKVQVCTGCGQDDGNWQHYPCPTVRAITGALA